jgi:hypothetical protein
VAFFGALFAARTDVYAVRYDNQRTGKSGWIPAVGEESALSVTASVRLRPCHAAPVAVTSPPIARSVPLPASFTTRTALAVPAAGRRT